MLAIDGPNIVGFAVFSGDSSCSILLRTESRKNLQAVCLKSSTWHNTVTKESWHAKDKDQSQPFRFRYHELQKDSCFLQPHIQTAGHRGNMNLHKSPQRRLSELSLDPPTGHVVGRRSDASWSFDFHTSTHSPIPL